MTTLCQKNGEIEREVQMLKKTANSQQHDSKHAELSQKHDSKHAELESDVGKYLKTHNKMLNTVAGSTSTGGSTTKKEYGKTKYANTNMNKLFSIPYLPDYT